MPNGNFAVAMAALLGGAIIIDYGVKNTKSAFASAGSGGTTNANSAIVTAQGQVDTTTKLSASQAAFAKRLNADTGLDPKVIAAWLISEEPASAAQAPNGANNWLNIGAFDNGGWQFGGSSVWANPTSAADATASFMLGHAVNGVNAPAYGSTGIRNIMKSVGLGIAAQALAIVNSGWASGHYAGLPIGNLA